MKTLTNNKQNNSVEENVLGSLILNTKEAAEYLRGKGYPVSPKTLEVWRCTSRGPKYRKIGRRVFYTPKDLEDFLEGIPVQVIDPSRQSVRPKKC